MISKGASVVHLARFVNGNPFKPEDLREVSNGGLPVVRIRQLLDEAADIDYADPPPDAVVIGDGDLIFAWSATLAARVWRRGPALLNQHLFRVDTAPGVDRRWFSYVLEAGVERLKPLMHGSAMTHITADILRLLTVAVPPSGRQVAVADYLDAETSRIDALVASRSRMSDLLEQRRKALIGEVFTGADPYFARQIHRSEPKPLRTIAEIDLGRARSPENAEGPDMVPYLRAANVKSGSLDLTSLLEMNFSARTVALLPEARRCSRDRRFRQPHRGWSQLCLERRD